VSFFKRLFGKEAPAEAAAPEQPAVAEEPVRYPASPEHFAIIEAPPQEEPVVEEEPLAEPQPTVESPAVVEEPGPAPITVARLDEATALEALERALDELGSAHHRPFSRS
jgi:hypothetical protein